MWFDLYFYYEVKEPQTGCESDYKRAIDKMMFYSDTLTLLKNNNFSYDVVNLILFSWLGFVTNTSVYPMLTLSLKFIIALIYCVFD